MPPAGAAGTSTHTPHRRPSNEPVTSQRRRSLSLGPGDLGWRGVTEIDCWNCVMVIREGLSSRRWCNRRLAAVETNSSGTERVPASFVGLPGRKARSSSGRPCDAQAACWHLTGRRRCSGSLSGSASSSAPGLLDQLVRGVPTRVPGCRCKPRSPLLAQDAQSPAMIRLLPLTSHPRGRGDLFANKLSAVPGDGKMPLPGAQQREAM